MNEETKKNILDKFKLFSLGGDGIGGWLTEKTDDKIFERLNLLEKKDDRLSYVQFKQLLVLSHIAPMTNDFFHYYWLESPCKHPYPVFELPDFDEKWFNGDPSIKSLAHLRWGLCRLFIDGLLYFGNVRTAFRELHKLTKKELGTFFGRKRFDTDTIKQRGPALPLQTIPRDDRYLISEMACKSFGDFPNRGEGEIDKVLLNAYKRHIKQGGAPITFRQLIQQELPNNSSQFELPLDEVLDQTISSIEEFDNKIKPVADRFAATRKNALINTQYYLSMVSDLDVYVATSMRSREDFREMGRFCDEVFTDEKLKNLNIRYFDPTLSAASGHEDKGLIECLMVKCAKVLIYCAGEKESYGKDAEAAMALSLGKPVIFFCDEEQRHEFYRDVHPLSRLVEFKTGVAVGAIVTHKKGDVIELLGRLFENKMQYRLDHPDSRKGYLRLIEDLTDSVVRLQTNDQMLSETFWNHYHD